MKTLMLILLVLLAGCAEPPTSEMIKSAAENCTALNKQIDVVYNFGGGYAISCK